LAYRIAKIIGKIAVGLICLTSLKYATKSFKLLCIDFSNTNGPSNKFIFRATYGNSIVYNIFPA
jgi:hypothetical protein